jgi:3-hydroxyacyl-[acyl-carrier-protein] dehydratase
MLLDGLYEVLSKDKSQATVALSDKEHPIFKAHFPSNPILPGFVHFEIASAVFNIEITTIKKAKFTNIVLPKQILEYKKNGNKFTVLCESKEVATFLL